jgi:hypothetical protein
MRVTRSLAVSFIVFSLAAEVPAHEEHQHPAGNLEQLGTVHFPVSCSADAQAQFQRAVAIQHSFWFEEAGKAFAAVTATDPGCAMGYWGIAMSLYHPLWDPPDATALQQGWAAVAKAKAIGAKTERERDYIAAIEAFYRDADTRDHRTRALAYEKAMEQVYRRYPADHEAAVFYALALDATALPTDKTYANQKKAGAILEKVFAEEPNHPGVAHYIIHSYDYPPLADRALSAARSYAKIAPAVPHALHMPSHIFIRLGLWQEAIDSNRASAAAAKEYGVKAFPGRAWSQELHALDYLAYAYLQGAQEREAKGVFDELKVMQKAEPEDGSSAYAFTAIPARYVIERRAWAEAASLTLHPRTFPWRRFRWAEANIYFARALGAVRSGNTVSAQKDIEKLQSLRDTLAEEKQTYWAGQVEIQRRAAAAWLAYAEGQHEQALVLMRSAAELEDATEKHPVTPGPILPARELLGELLLALKHPAQALSEFETSLSASPNRFNGLSGAAQAAQQAGDVEKAHTYYARLVSLGEQAGGSRRELAEARAFLTQRQ